MIWRSGKFMSQYKDIDQTDKEVRARRLAVPSIIFLGMIAYVASVWWSYNQQIRNVIEGERIGIVSPNLWNDQFTNPKDYYQGVLLFGSFGVCVIYYFINFLTTLGAINAEETTSMVVMANAILLVGYTFYSTVAGFHASYGIASTVWETGQLGLFLAGGIILTTFLVLYIMLSRFEGNDPESEAKNNIFEWMGFNISKGAEDKISRKSPGERFDGRRYGKKKSEETTPLFENPINADELGALDMERKAYDPYTGISRLQYGQRFPNLIGSVPVMPLPISFVYTFMIFGLCALLLVTMDQLQTVVAYLCTFILPYMMAKFSGSFKYFPAYFASCLFWFYAAVYFLGGLGYSLGTYDVNKQIMLINRADVTINSANGFGSTGTILLVLLLSGSFFTMLDLFGTAESS